MLAGNLQLTGFSYGCGEGKNVNGDDLKILAFKDATSQFQIAFAFTNAEYDAFIQTITGSNITVAREMPRIIT